MLTKEEKKLEDEWKKCGVFTTLDTKIIPLFEPAVIVTCYDKRYFSQWYRHIAEMAATQQQREVAELAPITGGGFPLLVTPSSPIHRLHDHRPAIAYSLALARKHGCRHAAIVGHYPCLAGEDNKIDLLHNVALLVAGKKWLKFQGMEKVVLLFDLNDEEEQPCVWHLKSSEFDSWCRARHPELIRKFHPGMLHNL